MRIMAATRGGNTFVLARISLITSPCSARWAVKRIVLRITWLLLAPAVTSMPSTAGMPALVKVARVSQNDATSYFNSSEPNRGT